MAQITNVGRRARMSKTFPIPKKRIQLDERWPDVMLRVLRTTSDHDGRDKVEAYFTT
jgi:hypothetical protein